MKIEIKKLHPDAVVPQYQSNGAAGMDVVAMGGVSLLSGQTKVIATGIAIAVPEGYEAQVRSRSGLAAKEGIHVLNSPGTIDCDFRGEVGVILHNTGQDRIITKGERIAQLVICPIIKVEWEVVNELSSTERGSGGFGSTGGK